MNKEAASDPDKANVVMLPPLLLLIFIVVGGVLEWQIPLTTLDTSTTGDIVGTILIILSFILIGWAVRTFRKSGEHEDVHRPSYTIVSNGPFAYTRNPMYLSFILFYLGITLILNVEWFVIFLPLLIAALYYGVIKREEDYLERKFGAEYLAYKSRVRRWL